MNAPSSRRKHHLIAVLAYVAAVLVVDSLIARDVSVPFDWSKLRWREGAADMFKFTAWFAVPLLFAAARIDIDYFTFRRWRRVDWILLFAVVAGGALVMLLLPLLPGVSDYYAGWGTLAWARRIELAENQLIWTLSWLLGWEFMHRYWLPKTFLDAFPSRGWRVALLVIPLYEALYHVIQQKPALECLGMGALSLVLTWWTLRRRNSLLPFLGHLAIEVELLVYQLFAS